MADINIVRKPPIWPWVATAAALALIVALILWAANQEEDPQFAGRAVEPQTEATAGVESGALREYLQFAGVTGDGERPEPGREHEYTAEGLRKLAAAIEAIEDGRGPAQDAVEEIRSDADRIQRDPASREHANAVRNSFLSAAQAIPGADLRDQAEAISPERPLLDQQEAIREFFRASGRALQRASPEI